ncbi:MAG: ATP-binding cassette domain-containing protein [Acholeplasmatales bacterium]|nr:ATP-binding cassette domain-containing protein [Acholeplasmatales bacterium]
MENILENEEQIVEDAIIDVEPKIDYVLQTDKLVKKYNGKKALNKCSMNVQKGDIYGFVGENGSGKTTIIRAITGLIHPESGSFKLFGVKNTSNEIYEVRKRIGAIVETPSIYRNMTAKANLKMQATILGIEIGDKKIISTLEVVGLADLFNDKKKAKNFSLGMRQRLGIAMALLSDPELLILDEPMNGLDPAGIVEIRELILTLNKQKNITFIISSHILSELSLIATKYGIISKGTIIQEISAAELKNQCKKAILINTNNKNEAYDSLKDSVLENELYITSTGIRVEGNHNINDIVKILIDKNIPIEAINTREFNFEDYYLSLLGGGK